MEYNRRESVVRLAPVERHSVYGIPSRHVSRPKVSSPRVGRRIIKRTIEIDDEFQTKLFVGVFGKIASMLLIPMLFIQPLLPLYAFAAENSVATGTEAVVPPPASEPAHTSDPTPVAIDTPITTIPSDVAPVPPTTPVSPASTSGFAISGGSTSTPEITLVEETRLAESTPPPSPSNTTSTPPETSTPVVDTNTIDPVPPAVLGAATTTKEEVATTTTTTSTFPLGKIATTTPPTPTPVHQDENNFSTTTATTSDETIINEVDPATTTDVTLATDTPQEEVAPVDASVHTGPTPEEIAEGERLKAERERNTLKKEVAEEFLRGCISFEHTGYYCVPEGASAGNASNNEELMPTVSTAQGKDGYKQIVVTKGTVSTEITHDNWDNAFPTQDITGKHFVWQGMKNGRWQIFYAETVGTATPAVFQLTDSTESNFNPKVDGTHIVWQGWVDENWEIFLATHRDNTSPFASEHLPPGNLLLNVGPEWSVERLTTNTEHDMFPSLHGDIVTWQAREGENWVVYAYSISTQTKTKLSTDGTKSENPQFAITWEEQDQQGHSRLMSYDLSTGKKSDLSQEARKASDNPFREKLPLPVSEPNQAALPIASGTGSSTPVRGDDDVGGSNAPTP